MQKLEDLPVVIAKDHACRVLHQRLNVEMQQIVLQEHTQAFGTLENGVQQLGEKQEVNVFNIIAVKAGIGVLASVVHDQIITGGKSGDLTVQVVLDGSANDVAQLQKGMGVHGDLLVFPMGDDIELVLF